MTSADQERQCRARLARDWSGTDGGHLALVDRIRSWFCGYDPLPADATRTHSDSKMTGWAVLTPALVYQREFDPFSDPELALLSFPPSAHSR